MIKTENISTDYINRKAMEIGKTEDIEEFIENHSMRKKKLAYYLSDLMRMKNLEQNAVEDELFGVMSPSYIKSVFNGTKPHPSRNFVIAIGLAMHLSYEELNNLLKYAGHHSLDAKRYVGDTCIILGLSKRLSIEQIDDLLRRYDAEDILIKER